MVKLRPGMKCQFENCFTPAISIATGRGRKGSYPLGVYCETHAAIVEDENSPEYTESCPNCGCRFGVN
jgi:hypothetical protein